MSTNFFKDNNDLKFYVEKQIDWEPLIELTEYKYKKKDGFKNSKEALNFYKGVLDSIGEFSAKEVSPLASQIDLEHPYLENGVVKFPQVLENIFNKIKKLELYGMCLPTEVGGMNCPFLVFMLSNEIFARADVSVTAHYGFHGGMAMAMLLFSIMEGTTTFDPKKMEIQKTRFQDYIKEIIDGDAWGSMDITEPGAGSDMAALTTQGYQDDKGNWFVDGQKIFITSGHAKYHFVIARTEKRDSDDAFSGLKGLSMFLVPAFEIDKKKKRTHLATFDGVEDKMGHHGSATVSINFKKSPAYLIGQRGDGFKLMLQIMNNARVGVGFESLGICEAAYRMAKSYASKRESMGKTIDQHEMIADYLDEMYSDIQGIRALAVQGAYHEEMAQKLNLMLKFMPPEKESEKKDIEKKQKYHQERSRHLTPLLKYLASEKAVEISRRCIQIHGGYGYITEIGAEKLLRDAMVLPIYEGTSQIQSLMSMKDNLMGILKDPKKFLEKNAAAYIQTIRAPSPIYRRVAKLQILSYKALQFLMIKLAGKKFSEMTKKPFSEWESFFKEWDPKKDFAIAMLHAERLTRIIADVAIVELLANQAQKFPEREEVLSRYLERAENRCKFLYNEITKTGAGLLERLSVKGKIKN
ncbi:MAG: acyl-CoA dehydrogenase family protein [Desulfobacterales bacterium]|nr:acyl-CoA dehydrogenase family protein [Desulfobacterales bacterium]MBF0395217.1 acyl-CoA dehydrogenase family protein [Desulfobacterales bacterium]